jgi:serine protease 16
MISHHPCLLKLVSCVILLATAARRVQSLSPFRAVDVLTKKKNTDEPLVVKDSSSEDCNCDVQELSLSQRLDHFDAGDDRHFSQRYFYSDRYVRSAAATSRQIAFLCVGGEGPAIDKSVLVDSVHCSGDMISTAKYLYETQPNWSIHLYALEHRYYGKSYPVFTDGTNNQTVSPITNEHLVYLSSRQALSDVAHLIASSSSSTSSTTTTWITFGGSYPGMLAAWARLKFPHLIAGAISNSAPIQAKLDFAAYNNHVARDLAHAGTIGGSEECLQLFVQGHDELIASILRSDDDSQDNTIAEQFELCNATSLLDPANVRLFLGDGVFDLTAQSNDPSCTEPLCNIGAVCKAALQYYHTNTTTSTKQQRAMETLAWLVRQQRDGECLVLDWQETLAELADPTFPKEGGWRSWLWQTCTEFGFYQTCQVNSTCPYGKGWHPLSQDLEICQVAFGVSSRVVASAVQDTNDEYGGWKLAGSRILSVTGDVDPWTEMALTKSSSPSLPVHSVAEASHHFWTHPVQDTDSVEVQKARDVIRETVQEWLELEEEKTSWSSSLL